MREENKTVSIIMPAYNAEKYIEEAIESVIQQKHQNWELLIINDGSTDNTESKICRFIDPRINYFQQENGGVASARNLGLKKMKGDYFCFLDADDTYYPTSLSSRLKVFKENNKVVFVDGATRVYDNNTGGTIRVFKPNFKGVCTNKLLSLSEDCFLGQTWMIKVLPNVNYAFNEGQKHSEDITFFLSLSGLGEYNYTNEFIMSYRTGHGSAMDDLRGLEKGYFSYLGEAKRLYKNRKLKLIELRLRIIKIMFLSYLSHGNYILAIKVLKRMLI